MRKNSFGMKDALIIMSVLLIVMALTVVTLVAMFSPVKNNNPAGKPMQTDMSESGKPSENPLPETTDKAEPNTDEAATTATDTDTPATTAPETDAPATTAPETDAPVTTAPETTSPPPTVSDELLNITDFGFLSGISTGIFDDASGDGSWYNGKVVRDLDTGEVTYVWDRSATTLALLDKYGAIYRKNTDKKVMYFTFDVGYDNGCLTKILDVLKEKDVDGIFFCTGDFLENESERDDINRIIDEGSLIGNHSYSHPNMPKQTNEQMAAQLVKCEERLKEALGDKYSRMTFFREPYGASCERDLALAQKMGYTTTFWSFTYYDYDTANQMDPETALTSLKKGLHDGAVYLLHTVSETNTKVLGDFIDYVRAQGYEIRRIDK